MCIGIDEEKAIVLGLERCAIGAATTANTDNDDETWHTEQVMKLSSGMSFRLLLQTLHDEEIINEEAILLWAQERRNETVGGNDNLAAKSNCTNPTRKERRLELFRLQPVQDFLEWLEDGDDDDEEEDDDEEDDEEDNE